MNCKDCGRLLTAMEEHYFTIKCEGCEIAEIQRIEAWRNGAEDPELDELYGDDPFFTLNKH